MFTGSFKLNLTKLSDKVMSISVSIVNPIDTAIRLKSSFLFCVTKWRRQLTWQSMTPYTGEMKEIEGFRTERAYIAFWADFYFLRD